MSTKNVKGVIIPRHDTARNWANAVNFIPRKGELIVYDADTDSYDTTVEINGQSYPVKSSTKVRFKFGDGIVQADGTVTGTNVNALPFQTGDLQDLDIKNTNIVNGSAVGSLRTFGSKQEDSSYKLGNYAMAEGLDTQSGAKAFTIVGVNKTNKSYTLDSVEGLAINDVYSAHVLYTTGVSSQAENYGKITAINGNVVTVDKLWCEGEFATSDSYISGGYDGEKNTFRIIAKPNVGTRVIGDISHAEGVSTKALGKGSHAEGKGTVAHGSWSHAEGNNTKAAYNAHAEGQNTKAYGHISHAEGAGSETSGYGSHAEGGNTKAIGGYSHTEGNTTQALSESAHAEGQYTTASGNFSHAEGSHTTASGYSSHAEGRASKALGEGSHAEGASTASGHISHAEGNNNTASGRSSHAEGDSTTAEGGNSHSEGSNTKALGEGSHAEGSNATAKGNFSHAEGYGTNCLGSASHTEGSDTTVVAGSDACHAEGWRTTASNRNSHAEGGNTTASGYSSHAEGHATNASGSYSHAEGYGTKASADYSHTEGNGTQASGSNSHVQGRYNVIDNNNKYADIIGNGNDSTNRSNAYTLDWEGNAWYSGEVYVGSTSGTNKDEGSKKLAKEEYVNEVIDKKIIISDTAPTEAENSVWFKPISASDNTVVDYPLEQGISGIWTYRKWNSGLVEMWGIATGLNGSYSVDVGYGIDNTITLPFSLMDTNYCVNVTMRGSSLIEKYNTKSYTTNSFALSLYTENPNISTEVTMNIHIVGVWKK